MLSAETLRVLTPAIVLLALILVMGYAWIRDRNARIKDLKEQLDAERANSKEWREVARESEKARDLDRENTRLSLDGMRTYEAIITGLRNALERRERDDK